MKNLLLSSFIIIGLNTYAADYYISPVGSDDSNGTSISTPWKTIAKINSRKFSPGDKIMFQRGGVWRETLTVTSSGSPGNPITFSSYGSGPKPSINGADIITGWTNTSLNVWSNNCPNATSSRAMVVIDGAIYAEVASRASVNSAGKYFIDTSAITAKLYIWLTTNPDTHTAEVSKRDYCIRARAEDNIRYINFINLDCRYAGTYGLVMMGPVAGGFCIVDSCNFYANRSSGCHTVDGHNNDIFRNSTASYNGNGFYSWISDSLTVSHCISNNNIHYSIGAGFTDGHGYGGYKAKNWIVENCTSDGDNDAIHADAAGIAANAIIRYNKVYNSKTGAPNTPGIGVGSLAATGVIQIYYNLVVNCASNGFESFTPNKGQVLFYNNTIYLADGYGTDGTLYLKYGDNFVFKNNILMREGHKSFIFVDRPSLPESDYNQFYQPLLSPFRWYYNGNNYSTLAAWSFATKQDVHSQDGDPLFIDKTSNWRLQAGSPCIDKGVDVGLTRDLLGNPIVGLPDIGAYEHTTSPPKANAGADQSITLPTSITTLTGSGTYPDGNITAYLWIKIAGPAAFTILSPSNSLTNVSNLVQGVYQFQLQVTDNTGATGKDTVKVTVNELTQPNQSPMANAGADQSITLPTSIATLTGSGTDPDGNIPGYQWIKISGPGAFTILSPSNSLTNVSNLVQGVYQFQLQVTDNTGATGKDTVKVTVNGLIQTNQSPNANAGNDTVITQPVNFISLIGGGTDSDGSIVSYQWTEVSGHPNIIITSPTLPQTDINNLIEGVYLFELKVTDNQGAVGRDTVQNTVTKVASNISVAIYPNPATTTLNLKLAALNEASPISMNIFDSGGSLIWKEQLMSSGQTMKKQIDLTHYSKGVYVIQIEDDLRIRRLKFVKQ